MRSMFIGWTLSDFKFLYYKPTLISKVGSYSLYHIRIEVWGSNFAHPLFFSICNMVWILKLKKKKVSLWIYRNLILFPNSYFNYFVNIDIQFPQRSRSRGDTLQRRPIVIDILFISYIFMWKRKLGMPREWWSSVVCFELRWNPVG